MCSINKGILSVYSQKFESPSPVSILKRATNGPQVQNVSTLNMYELLSLSTKARIFLLVDLRDFFSDLGSGGRKSINKKALKMTS